jgi:hypothetical protein
VRTPGALRKPAAAFLSDAVGEGQFLALPQDSVVSDILSIDDSDAAGTKVEPGGEAPAYFADGHAVGRDIFAEGSVVDADHPRQGFGIIEDAAQAARAAGEFS